MLIILPLTCFFSQWYINICICSIELVEVGLEDAQIQEELGFLRFSLEIVPFSEHQSLLSTSKVVKVTVSIAIIVWGSLN